MTFPAAFVYISMRYFACHKPFLLMLLITAGLVVGCKQEKEEPGLIITWLSPELGPKFTQVTLHGHGFSTNPAQNTVMLNNKLCPVISATQTSLTVTIPIKAGSGPIQVKVKEGSTQSPAFTYQETAYVSTLAGSYYGYRDGIGSQACFTSPGGIMMSKDSLLYVVDLFSNTIRKITPSGVVSTVEVHQWPDSALANTPRGFYYPTDATLSQDGAFYILDGGKHRICKMSSEGVVSVLAGGVEGYRDGLGSQAQFNEPNSIVVSREGMIYVADSYNHRIRKITPQGQVSTLAGSEPGFADGQGAQAQFFHPQGLALANDGTLYVADAGNARIRKISRQGVVSTLAGGSIGYADGKGSQARFKSPDGMALAADGSLFVVDVGNNRIRKVSPTGLVYTIAGSEEGTTDGEGAEAKFKYPRDIVLADPWTLYITDTANSRIRKIVLE
jgi:sugar lactone lactonase YvrE